MKKAFDQTVRDLKREVNKKVLKVPGIEQKILDATSNEPWGPHGSTLADIAHATRNSYEYQMIMTVVWKRINDTGKNWRHVYKGLTVLEYLVGNGSERVIDDIKERQYHISTLSDFHYIDSKGRDQGNNVRRKSQSLIALVNDRERIAEAREKASSNRDKFRNTFSSDGNYRSGGRYDDDRYEGRYGSRDDDRNGYGRERNGGYRDDDRYGRYGDRDGRHSEDRYNYQDDDYRGRSRDDNYRYESRSRSADRERVRPYDDDDRYSSRSGGGRSDGPSHEPRPLERKLSDPNISAQPNSEEAANDTPTSVPETKRDEGSSDVPAPKAPLPTQSTASETASTSPVGPALVAPSVPASDGAPTLTANEGDMFDEFDPRGFEPAAPASSSGLDLDLFGSLSAEDSINSLALVPASSSTATSGPDPAISGFESNFVATSVSQPGVNPFGDAPFVASQDDFVAQQQSPAASFQTGFGSTSVITPETAVTAKVESGSGFDFGESFQAVSYASDVTNTQPAPATSGFSPAAVPNQNNDVLDELFPLVATTTSLETQSSLPRAHTAPSELVTESVQPEQSQMQVSQMQVPQIQVPQMQAPQMEVPQMQAPQMQVPQMQASQMQASQMQAPQMQAPQMQPPQMQPPQMQAPQMQAPQMQAPQMQAPQMQAPQPEPGFLARGSSAPLPPQAAPAYNSQQVLPNTSGIMPKAASLNNLGQLGSSSSSLEAAPASLSGNPLFPQGVTPTTSGAPSKPAEKFETKSTVWADTLSRGLVNLDISGPKANPLADIGVDFDTLNRKEKREEKKSIAAAPVSTITMGKAMGSGSGMGRGNAGAPPPNPMMGSGMGMGMNMVAYGGGGMNQPMGMGMNQGMQQPNPGVPPAAGVPGSIFNPAMGTRGYGSQPYGGYR